MRDPGGGHGVEQRGQLGGKLGEIEVAVGVDEHGGQGSASDVSRRLFLVPDS
jgi:hypothetical protein